jgi:hypothetical protein
MNNKMSEMSEVKTIDFKSLNLPISELVLTLSDNQQQEIFDYLNQLNDYNKKAYVIASEHLGTSFNIYKSNGFKEWKNKSH